MGDRLQAGKPSWYVTSHPGQLSLAIPPWVGAMSTSESLMAREGLYFTFFLVCLKLALYNKKV